jgi:hypothetical protein
MYSALYCKKLQEFCVQEMYYLYGGGCYSIWGSPLPKFGILV